MTPPAAASLPAPPARVLLATDLSPRCDRALDRAARLALDWRAGLTAVHVVDGPDTPDRILAWASGDPSFDARDDAHRLLADDLAGVDPVPTVRVVRGNDAAALIEAEAEAGGAGLVVTGVARDEPFGRFLLGSTVVRLARRLSRPLLVVRQRVRGPYRRPVVATDLSEGSAQALRTAAGWLPRTRPDVFHAGRVPGTSGLPDAGDGFPPASAETRARCERFVDASGVPRPALGGVVALRGAFEPALTRHVREQDADLVVMGGHESVGFLDALLGRPLDTVLQWVPCDVLVVPAAGGEAP